MSPGRLIYLHGFASGPGSAKGRYLSARLAAARVDLETPDLTAGDFRHATLTRQLTLLDGIVSGESVILVGSSLGGYLAALYAARHPEVEKLILLAPAFDFHARWTQMLGGTALREWEETGLRAYFHHATGQDELLDVEFLKDAARYEPYPEVRQASLILHGRNDEVVPVEFSREFSRRSPNRRLAILETDHGMLNATAEIWNRIRDFLGLPQ